MSDAPLAADLKPRGADAAVRAGYAAFLAGCAPMRNTS